MRDIIGFLIIVAGSSIDPIRLLGYVVAGSSIRKRGMAVVVGVVWMLAIQVFIALAKKEYQSSIPTIQTVGALTGSVLTTLLVHWIASKVRANK